MDNNTLPLKELSIKDLFGVDGSEKLIFEIPIYQRNYAWEKDEITALVQDIYDSYVKNKYNYYIGTLVTYHKGDNVFEVIDGQQRLTTICLLLSALGDNYENKLTYRARMKSDNTIKYIKEYKNDETQNSGKTIKQIPSFDIDDKDIGIINGYKHIEEALKEIVTEKKLSDFSSYFKEKVHIIHYQVPMDIDLNHYFEIMNSRGEQLEKHEIVKAELMSKLDENDRKVFSIIWDACFEMGTYIQQNIRYIETEDIFGEDLSKFKPTSFIYLNYLTKKSKYQKDNKENANNKINKEGFSINNILETNRFGKEEKKDETKDKFQPIIDFPNFLLIVLKITLMQKESNISIILDDRELLNEFNKIIKGDKGIIKEFAFNLLKSRFYLDNYIIHHSNEEESENNNPWCLEVWYKNGKNYYPKSLCDNDDTQMTLKQLLSMFEVSYSAKQRKNYLFYILYYLVNPQNNNKIKIEEYVKFVEKLSDRYFYEFYVHSINDGQTNTTISRDFDTVMLDEKELNKSDKNNANINKADLMSRFNTLYGNSTRIPLFVFNYLDYKIWKLYCNNIRGNNYDKKIQERKDFFENKLGCSDFGLDIFDKFYFSRTRRSLEHFYPQAKAVDDSDKNHQIKAVDNSETQSTETDNNSQNNVDENNRPLTKTQINCFGNYAMIGSEANSSGSNWDPKTKVVHYRDKKINRVGVASLKFWIMMQICEKEGWKSEQIQTHQNIMLELLSEDISQKQNTTSS